MQLPEFIKKVVGFVDKWEANLSASAEKLATALAEVKTLTDMVAARDLSLQESATKISDLESKVNASQDKITTLEADAKTKADEIATLKGSAKSAGQQASEIISTQATEPLNISANENPAGASTSTISGLRSKMEGEKDPVKRALIARQINAIRDGKK